jgi:hypothetical protein
MRSSATFDPSVVEGMRNARRGEFRAIPSCRPLQDDGRHFLRRRSGHAIGMNEVLSRKKAKGAIHERE